MSNAHGNIRSFVNIFVGNDDIRNLLHGDTVVKSDMVISIDRFTIAGESVSLKIERPFHVCRFTTSEAGSIGDHCRLPVHDCRLKPYCYYFVNLLS